MPIPACRPSFPTDHGRGLALAFALLAAAAAGDGGAGLNVGAFGVSEMVPVEPEDMYPKGLLVVPKGGADKVEEWVEDHMEPRHAVAVGAMGKGTKRHRLLEGLAEDGDLYPVVALGVRFATGKSSLTVYRNRYPAVKYDGKWTRSAIRAWLLDVAYPPVNRLQSVFAAPKYLIDTLFGAVLIAKPLEEQTDELVKALEPYAEQFRGRLKFTFFANSSEDPVAAKLSEVYGVWTTDELIVLERPRAQKPSRKHSHTPGCPKYRLQGVTPERIEQFFTGYERGSWPQYLVSASANPAAVFEDGIRVLSGWDFVETVTDPAASVLVVFTSKNCTACDVFAATYSEVARRVRDARARSPGAFANLTLAQIDQSANEHTETVGGTPLLRYWPRGWPKRATDVDVSHARAILEFLEERAVEEADVLPGSTLEGSCAAGTGAASTLKSRA